MIASGTGKPLRVLTFSSLFPNAIQPNAAVFIKHRMAAVQKYCDAEVKVVAPVPYFPNLPFATKWQHFSRVPVQEVHDGMEVWHPRYLVTPKVGMSLYWFFMFCGAISTVRRIYRDFPFDIIDAHYVYPDGLAAVLLGKLFNKPVVLSARGTDINLYPQLRLIRPLVYRALRGSSRLISVCSSLKEIMIEVGADPEKCDVIPNGIDPELFFSIEKSVARGKLDLEQERKIVLTVGALIERKGMHLLIEAIAQMKKNGAANFDTLVVGEGPWRGRLQRAIEENGLQDCVRLVGPVRNGELSTWYSAADLFFLGSSREGWPNVVSEALACGTPVVATDVHGIPEILAADHLGFVVRRTVADFVSGLTHGLSRNWERRRISQTGRVRTWEVVAHEVYRSFTRALDHFDSPKEG